MFFKKSFGFGGIRPEEFKDLTHHKKIENADVPNIAYIPVVQHIGSPSKVIVKVGQKIDEGQLIAESTGLVSANIHSSIPGTVIEIKEDFISTGTKCKIIVIEMGGIFKKSGKSVQLADWRSLSKKAILNIIKDAGIVGLGGATFPAHVKLNIPAGKSIDTLIINGSECEPFVTCDHRLMIDYSEELLEGIEIINSILEAKNIYIGIEENKKDAIKRLKALCLNRYDLKIIPLRIRYPQGDEKQIIKAITGRIVPVDKLPFDINCVVFNVSTAVAIKEAVVNDKPLIDRVVTVTGSGIVVPKNLKVKIGTTISEVIEECGGLKPNVKKIIIGGPLMGFAQASMDIPVTKNCFAIIALTDEEYVEYKENATCINCGRCIIACAYGLMPTVLNKYIKYEKYADSINEGLMYCKECGGCSWACPARIPLVQNLKMAKDISKKLKLI